MTYAQYGLVQAADYNALTGGPTSTGANTLNAVWATGTGNAGYGQTSLANVTSGTTVFASDWANLVNKTSNAASHQGSSITSVTAPISGGVVTYLSAVPTNLQTIYTNRLNAQTVGSTTSITTTYSSTWLNSLTFTQTATFSSANAARYFFNSGGQLKIGCIGPQGTGINLLFNTLSINVGTIVLSSPTGGTANIAGVNYNGVTKVGGSGTVQNLAVNYGFYALTSTPTEIFKQAMATGPGYYLGSFIQIKASLSGSIVTLTTVWDSIPNTYTINGCSVVLTAQYPETAHLTNSWGTVTLAGSVVSGGSSLVAPTNSSPPAITGTTVVGSALSCTTGVWTGTPASFTYSYQWKRNGSTNIGTNSSSYTLVSGDIGATISCIVTASNGVLPNGTATSNSLGPISPATAAPSNSSPPAITGTTTVGSALSCTTGVWTGTPASFTYSYQWKRNGSTNIGTNSSSYTLVSGDAGATITCVVTASNGVSPDGTATSNSLGPINYAPTNSSPPAITGTTTVGQTLSSTSGTWAGYPASFTYSYQWKRNGSTNIGTDSSSYTLVSGDIGATISCIVTASNGILPAGTATSNSLGPVVAASSSPSIVNPPVLSGTTIVGNTLQSTTGVWQGEPAITTFSYQWKRNGTTNIGTNSWQYTLVSADVGNTITCVVTASNGIAPDGVATSNSVVISGAPSNTSPPVISGTPTQGQTLSCTTGNWSGYPASFTYSYQWKRGTTNIGTNSSSYTLVSGDIGYNITCVVTASNGILPAGTATSNSLGPVVAAATRVPWPSFGTVVITSNDAQQISGGTFTIDYSTTFDQNPTSYTVLYFNQMHGNTGSYASGVYADHADFVKLGFFDDTSTVGTGIGNGRFRYNNTNPLQVTEIYTAINYSVVSGGTDSQNGRTYLDFLDKINSNFIRWTKSGVTFSSSTSNTTLTASASTTLYYGDKIFSTVTKKLIGTIGGATGAQTGTSFTLQANAAFTETNFSAAAVPSHSSNPKNVQGAIACISLQSTTASGYGHVYYVTGYAYNSQSGYCVIPVVEASAHAALAGMGWWSTLFANQSRPYVQMTSEYANPNPISYAPLFYLYDYTATGTVWFRGQTTTTATSLSTTITDNDVGYDMRAVVIATNSVGDSSAFGYYTDAVGPTHLVSRSDVCTIGADTTYTSPYYSHWPNGKPRLMGTDGGPIVDSITHASVSGSPTTASLVTMWASTTGNLYGFIAPIRSSWMAAPQTVTTEWYIGGVATGNHTNSYQCTPSDQNKLLEFKVTATNTYGSTTITSQLGTVQ